MVQAIQERLEGGGREGVEDSEQAGGGGVNGEGGGISVGLRWWGGEKGC